MSWILPPSPLGSVHCEKSPVSWSADQRIDSDVGSVVGVGSGGTAVGVGSRSTVVGVGSGGTAVGIGVGSHPINDFCPLVTKKIAQMHILQAIADRFRIFSLSYRYDTTQAPIFDRLLRDSRTNDATKTLLEQIKCYLISRVKIVLRHLQPSHAETAGQ